MSQPTRGVGRRCCRLDGEEGSTIYQGDTDPVGKRRRRFGRLDFSQHPPRELVVLRELPIHLSAILGVLVSRYGIGHATAERRRDVQRGLRRIRRMDSECQEAADDRPAYGGESHEPPPLAQEPASKPDQVDGPFDRRSVADVGHETLHGLRLSTYETDKYGIHMLRDS